MADNSTASVIPLHQVPPKRKDKTGAERAKTSRPRKPRKAKAAVAADEGSPTQAAASSSDSLIPEEYLSTYLDHAEPPVTPPPAEPAQMPETAPAREPVVPSAPSRRRHLAPLLLSAAALALAGVGITINGWFARSLGSSDLAGWLFLAVGVAADLAALVLPSTAAGLWHTGQRATALVGWASGL